jgi:hypothetical protein
MQIRFILVSSLFDRHTVTEGVERVGFQIFNRARIAGFLSIAFAVALLGPSLPANAQEMENDSKRRLIHELADLMQADQTAEKTANAMMKQFEIQYPKMLAESASKRSDLTPEELQRINRLAAKSFARFSEKFRAKIGEIYASDEFFEGVYYTVYSKHFTDAELRELIEFYRSPLGQKMLRVQPEFAGDILQQTFEVIGPKLEKLVEETLHEETERLKNAREDAA